MAHSEEASVTRSKIVAAIKLAEKLRRREEGVGDWFEEAKEDEQAAELLEWLAGFAEAVVDWKPK